MNVHGKKTIFAMVSAILLLLSGFEVIGVTALKSEDTMSEDNKIEYEPVSGTEIPVYENAQDRLEKMTVVAKDKSAEMYYDPQTAQVAVKQLGNGKVWFSSPFNTGALDCTDDVKSALWSPVNIAYYDLSFQKLTMNSFTDASALGQIESYKIKNGVRVNMTLGQKNDRLVPRAISVNSFETVIMPSLSGREKKQVKNAYRLYDLTSYEDEEIRNDLLSSYPGLAEGPCYILKDVSDKVGGEVEQALRATPYTVEQMKKDEDAVFKGTKKKKKASAYFSFSVFYYLEEGKFVVQIPSDTIKYDHNQYILQGISVLPYFGASDGKNDGYLFIPDGSGATLPLGGTGANDGVNIVSDYYGPDTALTFDYTDYISKQMRLPVFGEKEGTSSFLAVIENGAEIAELTTVTKESESGLSRNSTYFNLRAKDTFQFVETVDSGVSRTNWSKISNREYQGTISMRYLFQFDDDSGYVGMAAAYRNYLRKHDALKPIKSDECPLYLETLGAANKQDTFLLFPVNRVCPLTTYTQMADMAKELVGQGVQQLKLRPVGWANGGIQHTCFNRVSLVGSLGGKRGWSALSQYCSDNQIGLYPDVNLSYVGKKGFLDGFSTSKDTARKLNGAYALFYPVDYGSNDVLPESASEVVRPSSMKRFFSSFLKKYPYDSGLSLSTLGTDLHGDYTNNKNASREDSMADAMGILKAASEKRSVMVDGANSYCLPYVDSILNLDSSSSNYIQAQYSVPFSQLVLHGSVSYAGTAVNASGESKHAVLKAIENGEALHFVVAKQNTELLVQNGYREGFSVGYDSWKEQIVSDYKTVQRLLDGTWNVEMRDHKYLTENVVMVTYANGIRIIVNYGSADYMIEGHVVKSESALRLVA